MNGIHDMGGMQDMGPIQRETREPVFHAQWERRVFALFNALDVGWPARRQQIELIPPADYLRMSYYERWLAAIEPLMTETGMMTRQEIESGKVIEGTNSKWRAQRCRGCHLDRSETRIQSCAWRSRAIRSGTARARKKLESHRPYAITAVRAREDRNN